MFEFSCCADPYIFAYLLISKISVPLIIFFLLITGVTFTYKGIFMPLNMIMIGVCVKNITDDYLHAGIHNWILPFLAVASIVAQVSLLLTFYFTNLV